MTHPHAQSQYQVRFDWGIEGAGFIAQDVDVVVVVDVLSFSTRVDVALAGGAAHVALGSIRSINGDPLAAALVDHPGTIVSGSLRNAAAIARWAIEQQGDKGDRFSIAVVGAGEKREDESTRFAVEDLLGAGAIIEALAEAGIDYYSPEAAVAASAFTGLRNATGHLIAASASGRELVARGDRETVDLAIDVDASTLVPVLREFSFRA